MFFITPSSKQIRPKAFQHEQDLLIALGVFQGSGSGLTEFVAEIQGYLRVHFLFLVVHFPLTPALFHQGRGGILFARMRTGRHVQGGVAFKKADRHQAEAGILDRHHRPVLGPRNMGEAKGMPDNDVGVLDIAVA